MSIILSTKNIQLLKVFEKGYKSNELGEIFSPSNFKRKLQKNIDGYLKFSARIDDGKHVSIYVHRLIAYQKFGDKLFEAGIQVRHLDGDCANNTYNNIEIGTALDNALDKPNSVINDYYKEKGRKYTDNIIFQIQKDREEGLTYKQLGNKYNIGKSMISYLLTKTGKRRKLYKK